jgi:hypothetical protein
MPPEGDNSEKGTVFPVTPRPMLVLVREMELFSRFRRKPAFFSYLRVPCGQDLFNHFEELLKSDGVGMKNAINSCKLS